MSPTASVPIAPALRTSAPSLASTSAVPPAEPAAVIRISSTSCAALALGDRLDRPHEHVEHVHAHRDRLHPSASLVVPVAALRRRASIDRLRARASSSTRGVPIAPARQ